jgi:2'-deoxynucleoside 5'-phosphate N-hydrolase
MTIYFAASISGGRGDQAIYQQIIDILKVHGTVLTEHFGSVTLTSAGENLADRQIHDRDLEWLRTADVLVAEVSTPSLGVGYEIGRAVEWGKRIVCLHRPSAGRRLSGMIAGSEGVETHAYTSIDDLRAILAQALSRVATSSPAPPS